MDAAVEHRETSEQLSRPHDTPLQRFGATLRQYRQHRGLSHKALAARMGIRSSYISEIELGKRNIAVLSLLRLAQALEIPAAWLLAQMDAQAPLVPPATSDWFPLQGTQEPGMLHNNTFFPRPSDPDRLLQLLGATLRHSRQQQGLTHKALAAKTGLDNSYIGEIERGERNVSVLNVVRLADALGLSASHLLVLLEQSQRPSSPLPR